MTHELAVTASTFRTYMGHPRIWVQVCSFSTRDNMSSQDDRFAEIYRSFYRHVHAYCRRRTGPDRADDAAAEAFLVAWRKIDLVPYGDEALPWLYRVAYGVVANLWRTTSRQKRLDRKLMALGVEPADVPEVVIVSRQEAQQILTALARLGPDDQEVLRLSIWEELSSDELAIALDVTSAAARQRLARARRRLTDSYNYLESKGFKLSVAQRGGTS